MKQGLQLRTSQHLALTPQLQQSIRLLQLSTLELHQELENLLTENPLLERTDDPLDQAVRLLADGAVSHDKQYGEDSPTLSGTESGPVSQDTAAEPDFPPADSISASDQDWSFDDAPAATRSQDDEESRPQLEAAHISLHDHLREQMRLNLREPRDRALTELIIDALDDNGYLTESLDDIYSGLPIELCVEPEELDFALTMVQSFEPAGIGARTLSECLALQIRRLPRIPFVTRRLALAIVETQLTLFAQRDFNKLKRIFNCDDEDLREAQAIIRLCEPRPGTAFTSHDSDYVVPDVIVKKCGNNWQVLLNQDVMPRLRISSMYANIMRQNRGETGLSTQLQEARWLIKNMRQRFDTILRVAQAIVERQRNFFTHGAVAMRPLVLREIADTLGLHESTISRVTTQKYMLTPHGMFELKYFFGSHVATETGGEASSTAIRALIKQLIGAEDQKSPLSDSKIADMLGEQGMVIARRTVAKYREALKIPPVSLRKSL
ncbi:RNA polymerase factor sigma-54 [Undibacterium oligocarboniphilum]|uniref:RNA polymerase sigma-54 factor n=1 Tax=Undibacterium oligocarboniphilum TaxID=666702 RepID=A0A850QPQ2_9BURK|nr:RNA polymerase factor sigma-54 [Undibacterium oligocarboniphilum]MBC3870479.1 RNA polymerase factor sigma-54 [Undibacterium oligocarboniphilum]NVO78720.1 RNA polymerase factor sigma-54 [Undibacterium oligocarboniphilum]